MRNVLCIQLIVLALSLAGCSKSSEASDASRPAQDATHASDDAGEVCEPGADQTCNDNPVISSLHGHCETDRTCTCQPGIDKNAKTGRCL